jgi:hypothetical protein
MKIEAVETATIPMGRRRKREAIFLTYINQDPSSSQICESDLAYPPVFSCPGTRVNPLRGFIRPAFRANGINACKNPEPRFPPLKPM